MISGKTLGLRRRGLVEHQLDRLQEIGAGDGQGLAELEQGTPVTDADRQALAARKEAVRGDLARERMRAGSLKYTRKKRSELGWKAERTKYERDRTRRERRSVAYLSDADRSRDQMELLEEELAGLLRDPASQSRDERIRHATDQLETMKQLVGVRRAYHTVSRRRYLVRRKREQLIAEGGDTQTIDKELEAADRAFHSIKVASGQLREKGRLLARLGPQAQALASTEPSDADRPEIVSEARDVAAVLGASAELMAQSSSPERASALQSNYERLEQELREEGAAVESALSALANEQADIQRTQAGSSRGPSWQERVRAIQEEQAQLRAQWRAALEQRLDSARRLLHVRQSVFALRDEAIEAELGREIALIERMLLRLG